MDDNNHSIFVHGLTEVEVKFMREILEVFCKDRKRKWLSYTLKSTKKDDCTMFTILVVQPCTSGEEARVQEYSRTLYLDELPVTIPSSEKPIDGTRQGCKKLDDTDKGRDASVTLKPNLEVAEQKQADRIIKGTHCQPRFIQLLENFFDEKDETPDFAETRQRHHNEESLTCKDTKYYTKNDNGVEEPPIDAASGLVYSLGPPFPSSLLNSRQPGNSHKDLIRFLELRMKTSSQLASNLYENQNQFHARLVEVQKENDLFSRQNQVYKEELNKERKRVKSLESKFSLLKSHVAAYQKDMEDKEHVINVLGRKLCEKDLTLKKLALERRLIKQKYNSLLVSEAEEMSQKMQKQLQIQSELKKHLEMKDKTLKQIRQILEAPVGSQKPTSTLKSSRSLRDVSSGEVVLGVGNDSHIEIWGQPSETWN